MSKLFKIILTLTLLSLIFNLSVKKVSAHETKPIKVLKPAVLSKKFVEYPTDNSSVQAQLEQLSKGSCPTFGTISSHFGGRKSPGGIGSTNHQGLDIANTVGTPIYAYKEGIIIGASYSGGYGNLVKIQHDDGLVSMYAHNSKLLVTVGEHVEAGDLIAKMGSSGASTGSHSHWQLEKSGVAYDPYQTYLEVCL